jgi:hypothetical protein
MCNARSNLISRKHFDFENGFCIKGGAEPGPEWVGPDGPSRPAQAGRPRLISAQFGRGFLPVASRAIPYLCDLHVGL